MTSAYVFIPTTVNLKEEASIKSMGYDYVAPNEKRVIRLIRDIIAGKIDSSSVST